MNRYEAHATDEWQRDCLVLQVRQVTDTGYTMALGQVLEDLDEMPTLTFRPLAPGEQGDPTLHHVPTPGIRLHREAAIAMAQEVIRATGAPSDPSRVAALQQENDALAADLRETSQALTMTNLERDHLRNLNQALVDLLEAKDAHLEREARTATVFVRGLETVQNDTEWAQHQAHTADAKATHARSE